MTIDGRIFYDQNWCPDCGEPRGVCTCAHESDRNLTNLEIDKLLLLNATINAKPTVREVYCIEVAWPICQLVKSMFSTENKFLFPPPVTNLTLKELWYFFRDRIPSLINGAGVWVVMSDDSIVYWDGKS